MALTSTAALWDGVGGPLPLKKGDGSGGASEGPGMSFSVRGASVPGTPPQRGPVSKLFYPVPLKGRWFLDHKFDISDEF